MRKNEKGFTLVELIVVIAIVAILAAVGIIGYTQFINQARDSNAKTELDQVVNVLRAQALADGLEIEGVEVVTVQQGQVRFVPGLTADQFKELLDTYAADLKGSFTLSKNKLSYTLSSGGSADVTVVFEPGAGDPYNGEDGTAGFTITPAESTP